jgi:hypothetical protein
MWLGKVEISCLGRVGRFELATGGCCTRRDLSIALSFVAISGKEVFDITTQNITLAEKISLFEVSIHFISTTFFF